MSCASLALQHASAAALLEFRVACLGNRGPLSACLSDFVSYVAAVHFTLPEVRLRA